MNTQEIITEGQRFAQKHEGDKGSFFSGFVIGATLVDQRNTAEIARLEAERAEFLDLLEWLNEILTQDTGAKIRVIQLLRKYDRK